MEYKVLPLFKSQYSLGKSILTLEEPKDKSGKPVPYSIFNLLNTHGLKDLVLVDDNISGLLQASKVADEQKIKLMFGLRLNITEDLTIKDDASLKKRARYIIFANNSEGYKNLLKIWSMAAKDGFYYSPCIDFKNLKKFWDKNVRMVVPFYDSFLYMNSFESHLHVPDLEPFNPVFLTEDNDLPFDEHLKAKVEKFCKDKYPILPAQSIFYENAAAFESYIAFRCIHNRGHSAKATLERPELDHMGSDKFSFEKWLALNKV